MTSISNQTRRRTVTKAFGVLIFSAAAMMAGENYVGNLAYALSPAMQAIRDFCYHSDQCPLAGRNAWATPAGAAGTGSSISTELANDLRSAVQKRLAEAESLLGL